MKLTIFLSSSSLGAPPMSQIHPMRAIFQIPKRDPPKFKAQGDWSDAMNDFLAVCLVKGRSLLDFVFP